MPENKVFLGGTTAGPDWRPEIIPYLSVPFFNPVVPDWNTEVQAEEERQKQKCGISLYVLTPFMTGVFSIAEIMEDTMERRKGLTVVCLLADYAGQSMERKGTKRSVEAVIAMAAKHGAIITNSLKDAAAAVNALAKDPSFSW